MGEKLFGSYNKPIVASFYHFKGKNDDKDIMQQFLEDKTILLNKVNNLKNKLNSIADKKEKKALEKELKTIKDVLYFENSKGNNIIQFDFNKNIDDKIKELLDEELNINSEKCKTGDCEFCNYSTLCNYDFSNDKKELETVKSVNKSNGKLQLSEAQQQVIQIEEGNYRINAVPGSGKSTTMVQRTIELIKKGYSIDDILLITFTNKGCKELKEKIAYWLKYNKINNVNPKELNIYTFNSLVKLLYLMNGVN